MKQRVVGAIIILTVLIAGLIISSKIFGLMMAVVAVLGFNEFFDVKFDKRKEMEIIRLFGIICLIVLVLNNVFYKLELNVTILLPLLMLSIPIIFYNDNSVYNIVDAMYVVGIVYFLGLSFGNIIYLRDTDIIRCIYIFIIAFTTDTYAYIGGMLIGRHKLTTISPKKTIEGSIIGTLMGTIIGSLYYYNMVGGVTVFRVVVLSLVLTIISELGDLLFSSIKRYFGKKDYSNLIPGHGGILDRFDSIIYVSLSLSLVLSLF